MNTKTLRVWLWDGTLATGSGSNGQPVWRSSLSSNIMLQASFELLAISIALFLGALGFYLGLAYASRVDLSKGWDSNLACLVAFVTTAVFSLAFFGQSLGQKDRELMRCKALIKGDNDEVLRVHEFVEEALKGPIRSGMSPHCTATPRGDEMGSPTLAA
jgi:hypothetical protein